LIEGTMLRNFGARRVGLHTTWSAPQAKNPSYAPVKEGEKKRQKDERGRSGKWIEKKEEQRWNSEGQVQNVTCANERL